MERESQAAEEMAVGPHISDGEGSSMVYDAYAARAGRPRNAAAAVSTMQQKVDYLQCFRGVAESFMAACGYSGTGGIGAKKNGISEALIGCFGGLEAGNAGL
jgi:hypothetical protein